MSFKRYLLSIVGQSNEADGGPAGTTSITAGPGAPYYRSSTYGMWPSASQEMANRGRWLTVINTAVGATSMTEQWVGRARAWASGQVYGWGGYAIYQGNVYKKQVTTVQTSTTPPAVGTGADGITWSLARAAIAEDVDGKVYAFGSALYDPNGYIAAAIAAVFGKSGFDDVGILSSIGQGDFTIGATYAQRYQAEQNLINHITGLGIRYWVGSTCYMSGNAQREAYFQSTLIPVREDILAANASNKLVSRGCSMRLYLGVLTDSVANDVVGLQSDQLHLTPAGYVKAGLGQTEAFIAGGW